MGIGLGILSDRNDTKVIRMNYKALVKSIYPDSSIVGYEAFNKIYFEICIRDPDRLTWFYLGRTLKSREESWKLAWIEIQELMLEKLK